MKRPSKSDPWWNLQRWQQSIITQLRTRHCPSKSYLYGLQITRDDQCRHCDLDRLRSRLSFRSPRSPPPLPPLKDKVNCSFYFKIGACRHGDRCSRLHNRPTFSQTILLQNLYLNPQNAALTADGSHIMLDDVRAQQEYDEFFEEIFVELEDKYGEIEEMNVCDNLGDHLVGNVYVRFHKEEDAEKAVGELNNRWFNQRPIHCELSPATDFREACCRQVWQYEMGECTRGGFYNCMHLKPISRELRRELYGRSGRKKGRKSRSRY
ncbi:splicing factor U2AF 26 kDa subunit-like, partial [Physella acuta]|uniref:splicing factor U2AF 26 kDa subunit-like n=1 Tax=Physella acuta TaxID=109671 RepID=UPI0027DE263D